MTEKQERGRQAIEASGVLDRLAQFSPAVVSTIFVGLDTDDSDIDILCSHDVQQDFCVCFAAAFHDLESYSLQQYPDHATGRFWFGGFLFEVYATSVPVQVQNAWRHYRIMQRLVAVGGEPVRQAVRVLKTGGLKTEPAIAALLGLSGDPFVAVLEVEAWDDGLLKERLNASL